MPPLFTLIIGRRHLIILPASFMLMLRHPRHAAILCFAYRAGAIDYVAYALLAMPHYPIRPYRCLRRRCHDENAVTPLFDAGPTVMPATG